MVIFAWKIISLTVGTLYVYKGNQLPVVVVVVSAAGGIIWGYLDCLLMIKFNLITMIYYYCGFGVICSFSHMHTHSHTHTHTLSLSPSVTILIFNSLLLPLQPTNFSNPMYEQFYNENAESSLTSPDCEKNKLLNKDRSKGILSVDEEEIDPLNSSYTWSMVS